MLARFLHDSGPSPQTAAVPPDGDRVDLVLCFGCGDRVAAVARHAALKARFPHAVLCGCSTTGAIAGDEVVVDRPVTLAFRFERTRVAAVAAQPSRREESRAVGEAMGRDLAADDLAGVFVLADGVSVDVAAWVGGLEAGLGRRVPLAGGVAAPIGPSPALVAAGTPPTEGGVGAVGLYGRDFTMSCGTAAGWQVFGPRRVVTRAEGNRVQALDGEPILDLYRRYLGEEDFAGLPETGLHFPLSIRAPGTTADGVIRAVLGIDRDDGALIFGGEVPRGAVAQLMRGTFERLAEGAATAARVAGDGLGGATPDAAILVSCIGRRLMMGAHVDDELAAVADVLSPATPRIGFYSYGEIAPLPGSGAAGLHNQTMTIVAFSER